MHCTSHYWRELLAICSLLAFAISPQTAWGQATDTQNAELVGTVFGASPQQGLMRFRNKDGGTPWHISADWGVQVVPGKTKVRVEGTAAPEYLKPGLFVHLTGEIDDKGALQSDVTEMTLVSSGIKKPGGIFEPGAAEGAKPISKLQAGKFEIRGILTKFKDGVMTIDARKKITGKLAADAKLIVASSDLSFAAPDSEATVKGNYLRTEMPNAEAQRLGRFVATEVHVKLTAPLQPPAKPTKAGAKRK